MSILCVLSGHRWHTKRQCFQKVKPEHDFESFITWDQCVRCQDTRSIVANPESEHSRYARPRQTLHEINVLEPPIPTIPLTVRFIRWARAIMAELRQPEPIEVGHEADRKRP